MISSFPTIKRSKFRAKELKKLPKVPTNELITRLIGAILVAKESGDKDEII